MKIRTLMIMPLVSILVTPLFDATAATPKGTMTLNLTGEIDMNINPAQSQLVNASLSGTTSFNGAPIYSALEYSTWAPYYALISLSQSSSRCNSTFVSKVPNQNTYGLELTHSVNPSIKVYVTPKLTYSVRFNNFVSSYKNFYTGQFFQENSGVKDTETPNHNVCFAPENTSYKVPSGGNKDINISTPGTLPVYIGADLTPGKLTYKGTPFFVGSFGGSAAGDFYLQVQVNADILVKRSCKVTGVSNQQINENMTHTNEIIRDSQFTLTCGGLGNPVNISAIVKEGTLDPSNPSKLVLAPQSGTVSDKKPWVMGAPYFRSNVPSLTCNDALKPNLLKFNNTDLVLTGTNVGNNQPTDFGIRWALCKPDGTKAGEYRGKVDVNIFVRG